MKRETLERLVIDHSLGELAPDAEELLVAYLDGNADAARSAEDVRAVIETARRTARIASTEENSPLPAARFVAVASRRGRRRRLAVWAKPLAAAAAIALAFWMGSLGSRPDAYPGSVPLVSNDASPVRPAADAPHSGFWSLGELSRRSATRREHRHPTIKWPSPVSRPHIGERS